MHSINENQIKFSETYAFGVKIQFSLVLKFLRIPWSNLVSAIGFSEAVDIYYLLILSRNDLKGQLNAIIQRENAFADP